MARTHLVLVGACAIDNILTVPHFPEEDSKLRALSFVKRRGGNCPNSIEVLIQLLHEYTTGSFEQNSSTGNDEVASDEYSPGISLIAVLPARESPQIRFITSSFGIQDDAARNSGHGTLSRIKGVDLSSCIYREEYTEPVSSYIISSQATSSRTIVNHNELPEMDLTEFKGAAHDILVSLTRRSNQIERIWFHFEGRIPQTTLDCINHLRSHPDFNSLSARFKLQISIEVEKPLREGLQELAFEADVIVYSRNWAEAEGYSNAETCLREQAKLLSEKGRKLKGIRTLVCTWGDQGAWALETAGSPQDDSANTDATTHKIVYSPAFMAQGQAVVDTVGAGDTFIAGMLFGFVYRGQETGLIHQSTTGRNTKIQRRSTWALKQKLELANGLAGRKVTQQGFQGLAEQVRMLLQKLDSNDAG